MHDEDSFWMGPDSFRILMKEALDGIFIIQSGCFIYANRRFAEMLETKPEAILGPALDFLHLVAPESRDLIRSRLEARAKGQDLFPGFRFVGLSKSGRRVNLEAYVTPVDSPQGPAFLGIVRDITGQVEMEAALRESEERWNFALEGAGDGVWDWNAATNEVYFSRQWKAMLGYSEEEIGATLSEWDSRVHPEDKDRVYEEIRRHFDGEAPVYTSEHRILCKDGTYKWILDRGKVVSRDAQGKPLRVVGTHTDLTERKKAEETIDKFRRNLEAILDNLPFLAWLKDAEGRFITVNGPFARSCGQQSPQDLVGKTDFDVWPAHLAQEYQNDDAEVMETRIKKIREEFVRDQGVDKWFETYKAPLFDAEGRVVGTTGFARDITVRKQTEEALKESERKFRDLAEKSVAGIYLIQESRFRYVNSTFAAILGYEVDELIDRLGPQDIVHTQDQSLVLGSVQDRLTGRAPFRHYEFRVVTKGREIRNVEVHSTRTVFHQKPAVIGTFIDITDRKAIEAERENLIVQLQKALADIKKLSGLLPICSTCKKIRNDEGYWEQIEWYIRQHSEAEFSHSLCPECFNRLYPDFAEKA